MREAPLTVSLIAALLGLAGLFAPTATAEEVDGETTRYLTPEEALKLVLPDCDPPTARDIPLAEADRKALEERLGRKLGEESFTVHTGRRGNEVYGHAVIAREVGKFKPFDFIVCVSPAGKVRDVAVLVYRESRGGEIARKRFNRQLVGKSLDDPIRINRDILNVTGATMSVRAVCAGVRKVLAVVERFVLAPARDKDAKRQSPLLPTRVLFTPAASSPVTRTRPAMGTLLAMTVRGLAGTAAEEAIDRAFAEVEALEASMTLWRPDSELRLATTLAARAPARLSPDLFRVVSLATRFAEESDGAFDPTVGPLVRLWGFLGDGQARVPADADVAQALAHVGWRRLHLDPAASTLRIDGAGIEIDLGGIGKGYAVDRALESLRAAGASAALVDFSGNLRAFGLPAPVDVQHPRDGNGPLATLLLDEAAVSTSGDYEKYFVEDGVRYGHILDPRTGRPVRGVASVTVVAPTAAEADALSTTLFVLGPERGAAMLAQHHPQAGALFVELDAGGAIRAVRRAGKLPELPERLR